jgi:dipeptidyl aminopeptidase/acylaminoacyl peptidase
MVRRGFWLALAATLSIFTSAKAAPPIEDYGKLPAITDVRLSPSGERVAFIATEGETRTLNIVTADAKPLAKVAIGSSKVRDINWAGDDYLLITTRATVTLSIDFTVPKHELETVIVFNVRTGKEFQVFNRQHELVSNAVFGRFGTAEVDGHWYGWFGGITYAKGHDGTWMDHAFADLYRVDLDSGDISVAARGQPGLRGWLVDPRGQILARSFYIQKTGDWSIMAGRDGGRVLASGNADLDGAGVMYLGRSGTTILVDLPTGKTGDEQDAHEFREIPLEGVADSPVPDTDTMKVPLLDPDSRLWIGEVPQSDDREAVLFSPALEARWRAARKAFPGTIPHLESWNPDFSRMVVWTSGGDDSGSYWLVDMAKHAAQPLGWAYPSVKADDVGPVSMVEWSAADGLPLQGILTLPPGRAPKGLPLVVLPHGGPEQRDYPGFNWWAQAFASRGYAVFQPNFRGSADYGVAFRNAGFGQWGRKMETDISDGVADLARRGIIDPRRACIMGTGYGGYAALAGVTVQQGLYRCAVSVAGTADVGGMLNFMVLRGGTRTAEIRDMTAFMGLRMTWTESDVDPISPAALANRADAPILLIHGKDDTVVPIAQSEAMERALRRAGKPVELVVMENEDHWLSREDTRVTMLKSTVEFVEKYNPPGSRDQAAARGDHMAAMPGK